MALKSAKDGSADDTAAVLEADTAAVNEVVASGSEEAKGVGDAMDPAHPEDVTPSPESARDQVVKKLPYLSRPKRQHSHKAIVPPPTPPAYIEPKPVLRLPQMVCSKSEAKSKEAYIRKWLKQSNFENACSPLL